MVLTRRAVNAWPVFWRLSVGRMPKEEYPMNNGGAQAIRVLVAEDDRVSATVVERALSRAGYAVTMVVDGEEALEALRREPFDALITDWMMPRMDGLQLIQGVRAMVSPQPLIMMLTALTSEESKVLALNAGADEYLSKPIAIKEVVQLLGEGLSRRSQGVPRLPSIRPPLRVPDPPCVGVVVAVSTGGPQTLVKVLSSLPASLPACLLVVQHAPSWMMTTFVPRLAESTQMPVQLAEHGIVAEPGRVYMAPAGRHIWWYPRTRCGSGCRTPPKRTLCGPPPTRCSGAPPPRLDPTAWE